MVTLRSKWFTRHKAILILFFLLLLAARSAKAFVLIHSGGEGDFGGGGSGEVTFANWSQRHEPGGTTSFILQFDSGVADDPIEGFGFGESEGFTLWPSADEIPPADTNGWTTFASPSGGLNFYRNTSPSNAFRSALDDQPYWTVALKTRNNYIAESGSSRWILGAVGSPFSIGFYSEDGTSALTPFVSVWFSIAGDIITKRFDNMVVNSTNSGTSIFYIWSDGTHIKAGMSATKITDEGDFKSGDSVFVTSWAAFNINGTGYFRPGNNFWDRSVAAAVSFDLQWFWISSSNEMKP